MVTGDPMVAAKTQKPARPTVYLDQWVWINLAKAANGKGSARDQLALEAVWHAAQSGVAFPLSSTTYSETLAGINDPKQRMTLARTVAGISYMRTLRAPQMLMRHQILSVMHAQLGRPMFLPPPISVLGLGAMWAFRGDVQSFVLSNIAAESYLPTDVLIEMNQWAEFRLFAGPRDDQIANLRANGFDPESAAASMKSRVDWENYFYEAIEANGPTPSATVLRFYVLAREVTHEHWDTLKSLFSEYRVPLESTLVSSNVKKSRRKLSEFADAVPSIRIAVELKTRLFRQKVHWTTNPIRDIDALAHAVPYSNIVVPDREMISLLSQSKVAETLQTLVLHLEDLPAALAPLALHAEQLGEDRNGWGGRTFRLDPPPGVTI
jgi:hypothetical protein